MYFYPALGILISCYILFLIWLYHESPSDLKVSDLKIQKRKFVLLALEWCEHNLGAINHPYNLKIYYYVNKKYSGRFHCYNRFIVIYVHDDLNLYELCDTVIHEFVHHLQLTDKSTEREYDKQMEEVGYEDCKYEVEARRLAKKCRKECLQWVIENCS